MKFIKTLTFTAIAIFLASCIGEPTRSPLIQVSNLAINSDSIESTQTPVPVGDTLQITIDLLGFVNELEYFQITTDREYTKDSIADQEEFLKYCNPLYSNPANGIYAFNPGVTNIHLTLFLIPKKAKEDETEKIPVGLSLKSNYSEKGDYNIYNMNFSYYITNTK
jgi:hypothetical protein